MHAGLDIGGTTARLEVFDADWRTVHRGRASTRDASTAESLVELVAGLLDEAPEVETLGVGFAGFLTPDGRTVINAPNFGWRDVPLAGLLEARCAKSVVLMNDLDAIVHAELHDGAALEAQNLLAVYVGTGVGGCVVFDRQILRAHGKAGEIGHSKVVVGGRRCGCGDHGCVEAYAGGVYLEAMVDDVRPDLARDLAAADAAVASSEELRAIWDRATNYLSIVTANACTLLNPDMLLLGGGVLSNLPTFRDLYLRKISPLVLDAARDDLTIEFGALADAGPLGAARAAAIERKTLD